MIDWNDCVALAATATPGAGKPLLHLPFKAVKSVLMPPKLLSSIQI
jgi:hypothetical protein